MSSSVATRRGAFPCLVRGLKPTATCVCEDMMTTGASPSPGATCTTREPEGYCVAARRGGELPEGKDPSQTVIPMKVNSIRPARRTSLRRKGEVGACGHLSSPQTPRYRGTGHGGRVVGVRRVRRHHGISKETRAGAVGSGAGVRAAIVAGKRVTTVEPRAAGR